MTGRNCSAEITGVTVTGVLLLAGAEADAQPRSASAETMLEEVVVTARRRVESLQDLPLSIAVMTAEQMQTQGIYDVDDVADFVSNVTLKQSLRANNTRVVIRGIGGGSPDPVKVFGSGMYIDGHYMPNSQGGFMSTVDIDRIEVLRGPQGTLFGKNVTGGAINIVSAKPAPEFDSDVTLRLAEDGQQDIRGMVNLPINDTAYLRLSAAKETFDGYYYNRNLDIDTNGTELSALRAALRFVPGNWTVDVGANVWQRDDDNSGGQCSVGDGKAEPWGGANANDPAGADGHIERLYDGAVADFHAACEENVAAGAFVNSSDKVTWSKVDAEGLFAAGQWDSPGAVGRLDSLSVNAKVSYRYWEYTYLQDRDYSIFPIYAVGSVGPKGANNRTRSAELIVTSQVSDRLEFTSGVNYFYEQHFDGSNSCYPAFAAAGGADVDPNEVVTCPLDGLHFEFLPGPRELDGGAAPFMSNKSVWNESIGVFGHVTYALTDLWDLEVGVRWTEDDREFNNIEWTSSGCDVGAVIGGITGHCVQQPGFAAPMTYKTVVEDGFFNHARDTFSEVTPTISFARHLRGNGSVDGMVYVLYSEGFLTGGFNTEINSNLPATAPLLTYDSEHVRNYEVGFKGALAGGDVRIMADVFYMDYTDKQDDVDIDNPDGVFGIEDPLKIRTNVSSVDIYGLEFEMRSSPWDGGFLSLDIGYLINEYGAYTYADPDDPDSLIDNSDLGIADLSPEWTVNVAIEHEFVLAGGATLTPRLGVYWQSEYDWLAGTRAEDAPDSYCNQPAFARTSARLTYRPKAGNWNASLFGGNITNEKILGFCEQHLTVYLYRHERPAYWGMEFNASFGGR